MINIYKEGDVVMLDLNLEIKYIVLKTIINSKSSVYYHLTMLLSDEHIRLYHVTEKYIYKAINYE